MGDGRPIAVTEAIDAVVKVGDQEHMSELLVLPGLVDDMVLGTDYLAKANTTMSCGGQTLTMKAEDETRTRAACTTMLEVREVERAEEREKAANELPTPTKDMTEVDKFLKKEVLAFENITGTTNIAAHKIIMRDDRPIKQRYFPKNPKM